MARTPEGVDLDQLTVAARRVLLDGLVTLETHLAAITVIGAQAVYLRSADASMRSAAYTSDGDLSIDPARLADDPHIDVMLAKAGFVAMGGSRVCGSNPSPSAARRARSNSTC